MPSSIGTEPPDRLVPEPRATNGTPAAWHSRTVCTTSAFDLGQHHGPGPGAECGQPVALVGRQRAGAREQPVGRVEPREIRQQIGHDARLTINSAARRRPACMIGAREGPLRMWQHNYEPLGDSLALSAPVAALPLVVLFLMLGVWRAPTWKAALAGLATALVVAIAVYGMPVPLAIISTVYGAAYGVFPIAWIVFASIMLYRLAVDTGKFEIIKDSVGSLTDDRRLQAMFIAFSFGAFIEGAAGFGAPVAVSGAMLAGLGFNPFYAAGICLLANTAPVAFGSIGIPVTTLAAVTGLPVMPLSAMVGRLCALISIIIPGYLVVVMAGRARALEVLPAIIACGVSFASMQFIVSNYLGPELTDILSSLTCIIVMVVVLKLWKPQDHHAARGRPADHRGGRNATPAARSSWPGCRISCWWCSCWPGVRRRSSWRSTPGPTA